MERIFSEAEANELLPLLNELLPKLQHAFGTFRDAAQTAKRKAASNGSDPGSVEESGGDYVQLLGEVTGLGVILRDPETGLCDFPALREGEPVFLCWRLGEERIGYWHPRDTGAAGRQPL